jgi:hypothetical protein
MPFGDGADGHVPRLLAFLDALPPISSLTGHAPVLLLPGVFEPAFCRRLIDL